MTHNKGYLETVAMAQCAACEAAEWMQMAIESRSLGQHEVAEKRLGKAREKMGVRRLHLVAAAWHMDRRRAERPTAMTKAWELNAGIKHKLHIAMWVGIAAVTFYSIAAREIWMSGYGLGLMTGAMMFFVSANRKRLRIASTAELDLAELRNEKRVRMADEAIARQRNAELFESERKRYLADKSASETRHAALAAKAKGEIKRLESELGYQYDLAHKQKVAFDEQAAASKREWEEIMRPFLTAAGKVARYRHCECRKSSARAIAGLKKVVASFTEPAQGEGG